MVCSMQEGEMDRPEMVMGELALGPRLNKDETDFDKEESCPACSVFSKQVVVKCFSLSHQIKSVVS